LLVEDEEMIRRLARAILEGSGHRVLEAADGEQALDLFESHRGEIDLVLLDMIMPGKSGQDTLAEFQKRTPHVPVVLASAYTLVGSEELAALGARAYVQKPYQPGALMRTVREVLDAASLRPA
jgi:CheY-like chemotaxis protein